MKLQTDFPKFDKMLKRMDVKFQPFAPPEVKKELSRRGIIISPDEIVVAPNGTLEYQGQKVILYIRDAIGHLPKYHVVDCRTLKAMRAAGRYKRYVVTRRTDGEFLLNFADNLSRNNPKTYKLDICKNCLWHELNLRYVYTPDAFPLVDWFNAIDPSYEPPPRDMLYGPRTTPIMGPISSYPPNWSLLSLQCRERAKWKCQECGLNLKDQSKFLHAHHLRGIQYDQPKDLIALCVGCHAEQPGHDRMKSLPYYLEFMKIHGYISKQETVENAKREINRGK